MALFFYNHTSDNVAPNATAAVQTGTAATGYEATYLTNLTDQYRQRPAKLNETTGAWTLDWGSAQRVDLVFLWHNLDAGLGTVQIQMNATNSWGAPSLTTTVTVPAKRGDTSTVKIFKDLRSVSGYSASGYRWMRINVGSANSVALGMKVCCFSSIRQLARDVQLGVLEPQDRPNVVLGTDFDPIAWAYNFDVGPRRLRAQLASGVSDRDAVRTWFEACGGRGKLTFLVPDPDDSARGAWIGRWRLGGGSDGLTVSSLDTEYALYTQLHPQTIEFDEVTAGGPEWL